jgi:hypothetical protein
MTRLTPRQYGLRTTAAMFIYLALMLLLWPRVRHMDDALPKALLAVVPALPMLYVIWLMARRILHSDELQQRTHLIGLGVATGVSAVFSLVCGFLASARLFTLDAVALILFWVFPLQMVCYGMARSWAARRYGSDGDCFDEDARWRQLRFAIVAAMLVLLAVWGWFRGLDDFSLGLLCGMAGVLLAYVIVQAIRRWRARRGGATPQ